MSNGKFVTPQLLLPVLLLSLALAGSFIFQAVILFGDHTALSAAYAQQEKSLQDVEKVRNQVSALATGTLKLAQHGDQNAQTIIDELKKAGVNVVDQPPKTGAAPGAPAAPPAK